MPSHPIARAAHRTRGLAPVALLLGALAAGCGGAKVTASAPATPSEVTSVPAPSAAAVPPAASPATTPTPAPAPPPSRASVPPPSEAPAPAPPPPAATVMLRGRTYEPTSVTVSAGSTVAFADALPTRHTVTAGTRDAPDPSRFDEEVSGQGTTVRIDFPDAGTYPFFCRIHFGMQGQVVVR